MKYMLLICRRTGPAADAGHRRFRHRAKWMDEVERQAAGRNARQSPSARDDRPSGHDGGTKVLLSDGVDETEEFVARLRQSSSAADLEEAITIASATRWARFRSGSRFGRHEKEGMSGEAVVPGGAGARAGGPDPV